jgi:DNA repair protein RadC
MSLPINKWSVQDRPREKFSANGRKSLSDAELLAIIIGNGTKNYSALQIAQTLLSNFNHSLDTIRKLDLQQLVQTRGIGLAKAISILSALELSDRCKSNEEKPVKFSKSRDAFEYVKTHFIGLTHEEFHIILLNNSNRIIERICISKGGITGTVADGRIIFKEALLRNATAIILIHNHPSGNIQPSESDKILTKNLKEFGKCIDISVLDHIILADNFYFSFADERLL